MVELTDRQKLEMYRSLNKNNSPYMSSNNISTLSTMGDRYLDKKIKSLEKEQKFIAPTTSSLYDKDVDYKTGVQDLGFRAKWARRDNDDEKQLFLNKSVGEEGIDWDRDSTGRYVLTARGQQKIGLNPTEKKLAIDETGMSFDDVIEFFSSYGLPIALGTAGAIAAPLTAGTSLMAALGITALGAGAGTFAGVLADEVVEGIEGYQAEKATDVFQRAALEALFAAAAEVTIGGAIIGGARILKGPGVSLTPGLGGRGDVSQSHFAEAILRKDKNLLPKDIKGNLFEQLLDPANANKTIKLKEGTATTFGQLGKEVSGMMPNVKNLSDKEILATAQKVAEVIFPNRKAQAKNAQAFASAVRAMKSTLNQKGKLDPADITKELQKAFPAKETLKQEIDLSTTKLNQLMQEAFGQQGLKSIKGKTGSPRILDRTELHARVEAGKRLFQNQTNAGYKTVDDLIGGGKVQKDLLSELKASNVSFENIAKRLDKIAREVPEGEQLKKFAKFLRSKSKDNVTLMELNHLRSILRGLAFDDVVDSAAKQALRDGVRVLDTQINVFKTSLGKLATGGRKEAIEALDVLGKTEEFYKEGVGLFRNAELDNFLQRAKTGGVRSEDIVRFLKSPEDADVLLTVMNPTRLKSFEAFKDRRLREALKFSDEESPIVTQYIKENLRKNVSHDALDNDPFVQYMRRATEENSDINKQLNQLLKDGKRVDEQLKKSLAAAHWTRLFGDDALANSKGFGTQGLAGKAEIDSVGQMVINPNAVWKEFTQNKFALEKVYGTQNYKDITNVLKGMTDNGIESLPLEAFINIAGKEAGVLIKALRQAQEALTFTMKGDDAVQAIMAARRNPDALNKIGDHFIQSKTSPLEITNIKNTLKTQGMNGQVVDDIFTDMTINRILPTRNQLSGDDLMNGVITGRLDNYVGDGAAYSRELLEELLGGGQVGKNTYENLKDLWRFSKLISESSTKGLSALKGATERTALAGFALLFAPGATIMTAVGGLGLRAFLRSKGAMRYLATRPRGVKSRDELLSKSNFLKRFTTRAVTQPIAGAGTRGQQKALDLGEEQVKEIFKETTPEGTAEVTETETIKPKRISMPMPSPQANPPGIERQIALGAAGDSPLNQALLRSRRA